MAALRRLAILAMVAALFPCAAGAAEAIAAPTVTPTLRDGASAAESQAPSAAKKGSTENGGFVGHVCRLIESAAQAHHIPEAFFARLIWTESRFDPNAVSPKGAEGIAQFMPGTSQLRGLEDPFDPDASIDHSARYLSELRDEFGNLGLAAAAYNAGEARIRTWLDGRSGLPDETESYVLAITGMAAEEWTVDDVETPRFTLDSKSGFQEACLKLPTRRSFGSRLAKWQPWGVHVAAHPSRVKALAIYARLQRKYESVLAGRLPMIVAKPSPSRGSRRIHNVRIGANSRAEATKLCAQLRRAGGTCVVLKN